jgi:tryptophan 2,3-dioxygenase
MNKSDIDPKLLQKLQRLEEKYKKSGQDLGAMLDGLYYSDYLKYWDYVKLDTLLSLQQPKTSMPDEMIFVTYHQITELYFKLVLWEMDQLTASPIVEEKFFLDKLNRIIRYFDHLINSFDILVEGMDQSQFLKFRSALIPSSGFQSVQYRFIELSSTDIENLLSVEYRNTSQAEGSIEQLYEKLYWQKGATEQETGNKTLSLIHFEEKYSEAIIDKARQVQASNLWQLYSLNLREAKHHDRIVEAMRTFDAQANVNWPLAHFKSAVRFLHKDEKAIAATGGTNWRRYLPPRFKKVIFYPELWSSDEIENWGRPWVIKEVFSH